MSHKSYFVTESHFWLLHSSHSFLMTLTSRVQVLAWRSYFRHYIPGISHQDLPSAQSGHRISPCISYFSCCCGKIPDKRAEGKQQMVAHRSRAHPILERKTWYRSMRQWFMLHQSGQYQLNFCFSSCLGTKCLEWP